MVCTGRCGINRKWAVRKVMVEAMREMPRAWGVCWKLTRVLGVAVERFNGSSSNS